MSDDSWLDGIEGEALPNLILSDDPIIRVIAGPGSGKTLGLKRRVKRLIEGVGVQPHRIFVGTFTRAIASELATELGTKVTYEEDESGASLASRPQVSTLHSLAFRLLKEYPQAVPGRRFRFLLGFETDTMLYDVGHVFPELGNQLDRRKLKNRVTSGWAGGTTLGDEKFRGEMQRWLERHGAMLIEEVVFRAREALRGGDIPQGRFDHVVIDEYQDLTFAEQSVVENLWSGKGSLVVLGDDNQSIYRFRDNHPGGVHEFGGRHEGLLDVDLTDNYRSSPSIVSLANVMMAQAGSPVAAMVAKRTITAPVTQVFWDSIDTEIAGLAAYITANPDKSFLVLTPRRFMGYRLKAAVGDDAATSFYEESLESHLARERFTLGSLLADESDAAAARTWLGFHGDKPEEATKRNAPAYASLKGTIPTVQLLGDVASGVRDVSGAGAAAVKKRAARLGQLINGCPAETRARIEFIFDPTLAAQLEPAKRAKAESDLVSLRDAALAILNALPNDDLAKVLSTLRYRIATRVPLRGEAEPRVRIMTLHGAKGLEADAVILMGAADQVIPGPPHPIPEEQEPQREEQRRLLYVAVTRARDHLIVSWPRSALFADVMAETIRQDPKSVYTKNGVQVVTLSRSTLLPPLDASALPGDKWLELEGIFSD